MGVDLLYGAERSSCPLCHGAGCGFWALGPPPATTGLSSRWPCRSKALSPCQVISLPDKNILCPCARSSETGGWEARQGDALSLLFKAANRLAWPSTSRVSMGWYLSFYSKLESYPRIKIRYLNLITSLYIILSWINVQLKSKVWFQIAHCAWRIQSWWHAWSSVNLGVGLSWSQSHLKQLGFFLEHSVNWKWHLKQSEF